MISRDDDDVRKTTTKGDPLLRRQMRVVSLNHETAGFAVLWKSSTNVVGLEELEQGGGSLMRAGDESGERRSPTPKVNTWCRSNDSERWDRWIRSITEKMKGRVMEE